MFSNMEKPKFNSLKDAIFATVMTAGIAGYSGYLANSSDGDRLVYSMLIAFMLGLMSMVFIMTWDRYLRIGNAKNEKKANPDEMTSQDIKKTASESDSSDETIPELAVGDNGGSPTDSSTTASDDGNYEYNEKLALLRRDVLKVFEKTESRISQEIASLSRRGNINLIIGGFIALSGIAILTGFILSHKESQTQDIQLQVGLLVVYWMARLSLVSLIEIFAFFFLRIYKTELLSIKYFQDELTGIESRKISLLFSILHENKEDVSDAVAYLMKIDRNFVFDASQTTVDLEKLKIENSSIKTQLDNVTNILKEVLGLKSDSNIKPK